MVVKNALLVNRRGLLLLVAEGHHLHALLHLRLLGKRHRRHVAQQEDGGVVRETRARRAREVIRATDILHLHLKTPVGRRLLSWSRQLDPVGAEGLVEGDSARIKLVLRHELLAAEAPLVIVQTKAEALPTGRGHFVGNGEEDARVPLRVVRLARPSQIFHIVAKLNLGVGR